MEEMIITGDFRELSKQIEDESIDLILTDPVYDRIDDYRDLARLAARILKPGGNCLAQAGHYYLVDVLNAMTEYLDYVWMLAETLTYANSRYYGYRIRIKWKPWVWFSKGKRKGQWLFDSLQGGGRDKRSHRWGDSLTFSLNCVERLTEPGDLVYDPFTGGGTTGEACIVTSREFIGHEIDPVVAKVARHRLANAVPMWERPEVKEMVELF